MWLLLVVLGEGLVRSGGSSSPFPFGPFPNWIYGQDVRELLKIARRRRFGRNEVVFHRDDPGDSLHLIVKGRFAVRVMTPLAETATIAVRAR